MTERIRELTERYHLRNAAVWALLHQGDPRSFRVRRWWEQQPKYPTIGRQSDGKLWAVRPHEYGLRMIGNVVPEPGGRNGWFMMQRDVGKLGWHTDPDGYYNKDGDGLVWGVVFQLPAHKGVARLVAGYQIGGDHDMGFTIDLSGMWEESTHECSMEINSTDAAYEAAKAADTMAANFAEEEREYQLQHREEEDDDGT